MMKEIIKINKEGGEMGKGEIIKTEVKKEFLESFLSRDDFERAEKVINTLPPEEKIQGLIKIMEYSARKVMERLEEEKWLNKIQEIANSLPESIKNQALENILKNYLKEGYVDDAEKIAKLLKRELTTEELEKALEKYLDDGDLDGAKEIAKLLQRELTVQELEKILENCLNKEGPEEALEVVDLLPKEMKKQGLEMILKKYVMEDYGSIDDVKNIAKLLGRELTTEELEKIWEIAVKNGNLDKAKEAAKLLPEPKRTEYLKYLKILE